LSATSSSSKKKQIGAVEANSPKFFAAEIPELVIVKYLRLSCYENFLQIWIVSSVEPSLTTITSNFSFSIVCIVRLLSANLRSSALLNVGITTLINGLFWFKLIIFS